jgi:hypothetical protein
VAPLVVVAVLLAPKFPAVRRAARLQASRARWFDAWQGSVGLPYDENGAGSEPQCLFRNGTQRSVPNAVATLRADDDELSLDIGGELRDCPCSAFRANMSRQTLEWHVVRVRVRIAPAL